MDLRLSGVGSFPMHAARAYGIKPPIPTAAAKLIEAQNAPRPSDSIQTSQGVRNLIAGNVTRTVDFDSATAIPAASSNALQMYTRAADKIEVAVAVQIGRTLDVQG